mgnify:CR=1 FL=1
MLYVGIDVAKNKHDVTTLNAQGKTVLKPLTVSNTRAGFEILDQSLRQLNQDCLIALEDTGHYGFNLLNFLNKQGYKVYTYNPLFIKEFTKSLSLRKTIRKMPLSSLLNFFLTQTVNNFNTIISKKN